MPHSITSLNPARHAAITQVIRDAGARTGTDFDHLMNTAMRESALNPLAKASTSSASGMFQFIEQTWLGMVKNHGAEHGLGEQAAKIFQNSNGRYIVPDPAVRREILALRQDTRVSALMAGELANDNRRVLENRLDREVSAGELYTAHVMGAGGAARLIEASEQNPASSAAHLFPAAARANRGIFYENGRARSVTQVTAFLTEKGDAPNLASFPVYAAITPSDTRLGLPNIAGGSGGNSLAGLGHNAQILSSEMIAIMASLDMPFSSDSDRSRPHRPEANPFGLTG
ncbi:MAG: hypothetical protein ABL951_01750 [Alphaproteobacteria bacterium]